MSSTRKTPVRTKAFTAQSTLSVLAAAATSAPKSAPAPAPVGKAANDDAPKKKAPRPAPAPLSNEERHRMIAKVAYDYAERSGFGSDPVTNWLTAEREINARLGLAS